MKKETITIVFIKIYPSSLFSRKGRMAASKRERERVRERGGWGRRRTAIIDTVWRQIFRALFPLLLAGGHRPPPGGWRPRQRVLSTRWLLSESDRISLLTMNLLSLYNIRNTFVFFLPVLNSCDLFPQSSCLHWGTSCLEIHNYML